MNKPLPQSRGFFMKRTMMKKTIILFSIILLTAASAGAQTTPVDTNMLAGKIITVYGDKNLDVKKTEVIITEGMGAGVAEYRLVKSGKVNEEKFPRNTGLYRLIVQYEGMKASELFLYAADPLTEKINVRFFKENKKIFCRITSLLSEDLNKVVVLE